MGELSVCVQRIGQSVGQLRDAQAVQSRVDQLKDKVEAFTNDIAPVIDQVSPTAVALGLDSTQFQAKVAAMFDALDGLQKALSTGGLLDLDLEVLRTAGRKVKEFGDDLRTASLEAWNEFKTQHLPMGAAALLEAAEVAGLPVPSMLKTRLEQVRLASNPSVDVVARAHNAIDQYKDLRQQLTEGNPEIEQFLVDLTSQHGVPLQTLNNSESLKKWLEDRQLDGSLVVVLGRGSGR